jgi:putative zinc finger protein
MNPEHESPPHLGGQLTAYLEGDLTLAEAQPVRVHLADCAACRAWAAEWRALDGRIRAWGAVEPRFAHVPASARRALRGRLWAPQATPRGPYWGVGRPTAALIGAVGILVLLVVAGGGWVGSGQRPPGESAPTRWTTFVSSLGTGHTFSLDYPSDWSLTQTALAPPSMTLSLRFSTYKPSLGMGVALPLSPDDAEIWLAVGQGSLQEGWPAGEAAQLRAAGYQERTYRIGDLVATRLTDRTPHFGIYDAVYVPVGSDFTVRVYLSAATAAYSSLFDAMLLSLQVGPAATPTPAGTASGRITYVRSEFGGTSTLCGTLDYQAAQADAAPADTADAAVMPSEAGVVKLDADVCLNAAHR